MKRCLTRMWRKFFINEHGAVSIYLIIVALLILLFNAVLIDYARILVAERQTEEAAKTALRSTMSSYNTSLQNMGLFAFDGEQGNAESIFKEVFRKNIASDESDQYNFLGLNPVDDEISVDLNMSRSLANKDILKYQILEEMKYKAPVEVGDAIIRKFLKVSEQVEQASDYAKIAKELNGDAKDREELLEQVKTVLEEAENILLNIQGRILDDSSTNYPNVRVIDDIRRYHREYMIELEELVEAEAEEEEGEGSGDENSGDSDEDGEEGKSIEELREDTETFKREALSLTNSLIDSTEDAALKLEEALELLEEAEGINADMILKINSHNEDSSSGDYDSAKDISEDLNESTVEDDTDGSLDDYVYEEEFFGDLKDSIGDAVRSLDYDCSVRTDALIPKLSCDLKPSIETDFESRSGGRIINDRDHSRQYYNAATSSIRSSLEALNEGRTDYLDAKDEIEEEEGKADDSMEENKDHLEEIEDIINGASGAAGDSEKLRNLGSKANEYGDAIESNAEEFAMEDRDETAEQAMSFVDTLFKNLGDMLLSARDEVYINEYILMRFKSHDFDKTGWEANAFDNNQVEYIIYGRETHGANYLAALSEIFAVRFAINLAAGFMQPEARGFGPFMWAYALAYSFGATANDMRILTNGDPIEIFPTRGSRDELLTMDYKDHLRLFLFAHPEGGKFQRLMAVTDLETGKDLRESPTYVSANATSTMKLWFLPQIIDMIGSTNAISGRVEGNTFYIEKEVNFSY